MTVQESAAPTLPNGITADYGYDQLNRLTNIVYHQEATHRWPATRIPSNPAGNRTEYRTGDGSTTHWNYDDS